MLCGHIGKPGDRLPQAIFQFAPAGGARIARISNYSYLIQKIRGHSDKGRDGRIGGAEFVERIGRCDGEDFHPGAVGGVDADVRVLDHEAVRRVEPQPLGGEQKDIRGGLSVSDIIAADHGIEKPVESGRSEYGVQVRAGG